LAASEKTALLPEIQASRPLIIIRKTLPVIVIAIAFLYNLAVLLSVISTLTRFKISSPVQISTYKYYTIFFNKIFSFFHLVIK
jgi:hypothetical protein